MKKLFNIFLTLTFAAILFSCSKEEPFNEYGTLRVGGLKVSIINDDATKASPVNVNDFTVDILKEGEVYRSYRYGDMPEVIDLPTGSYSARAYFGENPDAGWDAPYYYGELENSFSILPNQITDVADPIVCKFANIKVTVYFDDELTANMTADSKVEIQAGESGTLTFTKGMEGTPGYFAYVNDSQTLVATFYGTVQGYPTVESKTYADVAPGKHYIITFKLHSPDPGKGEADLALKVDAKIITEDINLGLDIEYKYIEDDMRPKEGTGNNGNGDDDKNEKGPKIVAESPVNLDAVNEVGEDGLHCVLHVTSATGITEFKVKINSATLTDEQLQTISLRSEFDLIEPGDCKESLDGLGFPTAEKVKNQKEVTLDISRFMEMLAALGSDEYHDFVLTVSDASGTTVKTLKLHIK